MIPRATPRASAANRPLFVVTAKSGRPTGWWPSVSTLKTGRGQEKSKKSLTRARIPSLSCKARLGYTGRGGSADPARLFSFGTGSKRKGSAEMVTIKFDDRETEKRALAFLIGRFSGRVLRSGEHLVPEAALEALADQNIPFTVLGKATYEQQMAALRGAAAPPV